LTVEADSAHHEHGGNDTLEALTDRELRSQVQQVLDRFADLQAVFEESLLDQELWTSVDLLQSMGMQHHRIFSALEDQIREPDVTTQAIKDSLRQARTSFSEWLYERLKSMSSQTDPGKAAIAAFEAFFAGLDRICGSLGKDRFSIIQDASLLKSDLGDSLRVSLCKQGKRVYRTVVKHAPQRRFSLRRLSQYHLTSSLAEALIRVAQMLGEAEFFLLRRVKGQYEEIDQAYTRLLSLLDREKAHPDAERWSELARDVGQELDQGLRMVGSEVMKYYEEIRVSLQREMESCAEALVRDAARAGTVNLPERRYVLTVSEMSRHRRRLLERLSGWGRCQVGFTGAYTMGLAMVRVQSGLRAAIDETVLRVNVRLRARMERVFQEINGRMETTVEVLRGARGSGRDNDEIRLALEQERRGLLQLLNQEINGELEDVLASGEINQLVDMLGERFRKLAAATPESFQIMEDKDLPAREGEAPKGGALKVAPVRAVVRTYLEGELLHRLGDVNGEMLTQISELKGATDELSQNVGFSLGTVAIELREVGKTPEDLTSVALDRMQRGLDGFRGRFQQLREANRGTRERVIREVADTARRLRQLVLEATVGDMRRRIDGERASWLVRVVGLVRQRGRGRSVDAARAAVSVEAEPEEVSGGIVSEGGARARAQDLEGILDLEADLAARVPFAYRRLFHTTPLEVSEFLSGRSAALGIIDAALKCWRQRRFSAIVIIGEQGSGKTSLVNCAMAEKLKGLPLLRHRLVETVVDEGTLVTLLSELLDMEAATLDELAQRVKSAHQRRAVLLEDLHRLHLRVVGGMDLLPRFLEFADATGKQIMWIVSIEEQAWRYLEHIQGPARHFAFRIETGHLSRDGLQGAIMARHRATGYSLRFLGPGDSADGDQELLKREFFGALHRASGGNVFAAIFYWLRSLAEVQGDVLRVRPLVQLELGFLAQLPMADLLDLSLLIEHGGLTAADLSRVLRIPEGEGRTRLAHLERMGLVNATEEETDTAQYTVNHILYHPISTEIRARNLAS
jgi:hypothetical protein